MGTSLRNPGAALHDRVYSFADLVPLYGTDFAERLADAWEAGFALQLPQPTVKKFSAVKRLLVWLAGQETQSPEAIPTTVYRSIRDGRIDTVTEQAWRDAVNAFCDRLRDHRCSDVVDTPNILTRRSIIHFLSAALRTLADTGLFPQAGPLKSVGKGQLSGGNIPTLGELTVGKRQRGVFPAPLPNTSINELAELNRVRLSALRACAVQQLEDEYAVFRRGRELMARPDLPTPDVFETALATLTMNRLLAVMPDDPDGQLGALLLYVNVRRQNRLFVRIEKYPMQNLVARLGGAESVVRHLEGTMPALVAAYTIVLIDTAFDIGTCDDLPTNPFVGTVTRGRQRIATISAIKTRAGGKVAEAVLLDGEAELPLKRPGGEMSGVTAIRLWQEMCRPLQQRAAAAGVPAADKLWLLAGDSLNQGPVRLCDATAFKTHWTRFLARFSGDPVIGGLPMQRRMIRPTKLQVLAADNDFDHTVAQATANHSRPGMTMRYLSSAWFQAALARKIRDFSELYEAALSKDIKDVGEKLGLAPSVVEHRRRTALDTGLGFVCLDPLSGMQPGSKPGQHCIRLDACVSCPLRRFIPTQEGLIGLILFNRSLWEQGEVFRARNPERWASTWLPYLALTEALREILRDGPHRPKLRRAESEAQRRVQAGEAPEIRLW